MECSGWKGREDRSPQLEVARAPLELQPRAESPIGAPAGRAVGGEAVLEGAGKGEVCYSNLNLC